MLWGDKRYNNLNFQLRQIFGEKVLKLSLDGGFTCPNRDGNISDKGCIFCSERGSGDFAGARNLSIREQIEEQINLLMPKWGVRKYLAYFQNFTNTYAPVEILKARYDEALSHELISGLAIATRPDTLEQEKIELLAEYQRRVFLWVELGMQTIHDRTAKLINRGYALSLFEDAFYRLQEKGIKTVCHVIIGLPGESKDDILETIDYISKIKPWGVKLHLMHILQETALYEYYQKKSFQNI